MEAKRSRIALLVSALITVLLYALPQGRYIVYPLLLLSTYAHEVGHGVTALLVGGEFDSLKIWADGSGVAMIAALPGWRSALVSSGGLLGPAAIGALCFFAARSARLTKWALLLGGMTSLLLAVWIVRNPTGWAVALSTAAVCLGVARYGNDGVRRVTLTFIAIQLALSVFSRSDYLFKRVAATGGGSGASDISNIANNLFGPHWFWGAIVGLLSVAVVGVGLYVNLRPIPSRRTNDPKKST